MKRKLITATLIFVLAVTSLLACSSKKTGESSSDSTTQTNENKTTKVVLNEVAHSIFYAPMYVAIEEGYFAEENIELDLVTGFGALHLVQK